MLFENYLGDRQNIFKTGIFQEDFYFIYLCQKSCIILQISISCLSYLLLELAILGSRGFMNNLAV